MHYPIEDLEAIPAPVAERLAASGIQSTDDLLLRGTTPRLREGLASETGLPVEDLTRWVGVADLLRIKGIGPAYAQALVCSGAASNLQQFLHALRADPAQGPTVGQAGTGAAGQKGLLRIAQSRLQQLADRYATVSRLMAVLRIPRATTPVSGQQATGRIARRPEVLAAAGTLSRALRACPEEQVGTGRLPTARELAEAAEEAAELRPRVVLTIPEEGQAFRDGVLDRAKAGAWASVKLALAMIAICIAALAIVLAVCWMWLRSEAGQLAESGDPVLVAFSEAHQSAFGGLAQSLGLLGLVVVLSVFLLLEVYNLASSFQDVVLVPLLFNTAARRAFFRDTQALSLRRQLRGARWAMIAFAVTCIAMAVFAVVSMVDRPAEDNVAFGGRIRLPLALAGGLIVVLAAVPVVRFFVGELRERRTVTQDSYRHYLIYLLSKLIWFPVLLVFVVHTVLPGTFDLHRRLHERFLLPGLEQEIEEHRNEIGSMPLDDPYSQQLREVLLRGFDEQVTDQLPTWGVVSPEDTDVYGFILPWATSLAVWSILAAFVLLVVVPYIVLWDWKKGLFYLLLVLAAFAIEEAMQQRVPAWFGVQPGSKTELLIILTAVFGIALFFDWVYDRVTEQKRMCPCCKDSVAEDASFCPGCGYLLE